jgi:pimeloyl-ACP methyl ester carboxylesterase
LLESSRRFDSRAEIGAKIVSIDCAYSIAGQGPALFLIHGIGARRAGWNRLVDSLKAYFTCITYDLRGHGDSPLPKERFGLDDLVDDLEALRARLGIERAHFAGHSLGGMIGPAYARRFPDRVLSLGLLSTAAFRTEDDSSKVKAVVAAMRERGISQVLDTLSREQQRLERKLLETVGFPSVMIPLSEGRTVTLHSLEALRDVLDVGSVDLAIGAKAEADLASHQARWDASDQEIGYSAVMRAESEAADRAEAWLEALAETPAISLAGVAAKLDAILREGQPSKDDAEFPWPQIRSALEDIGRIGGQTEPS